VALLQHKAAGFSIVLGLPRLLEFSTGWPLTAKAGGKLVLRGGGASLRPRAVEKAGKHRELSCPPAKLALLSRQ